VGACLCVSCLGPAAFSVGLLYGALWPAFRGPLCGPLVQRLVTRFPTLFPATYILCMSFTASAAVLSAHGNGTSGSECGESPVFCVGDNLAFTKLYTILPLSILYGVWHTNKGKGGSAGAGRAVVYCAAIAIVSAIVRTNNATMQVPQVVVRGGPTRAQKPQRERISCKGQVMMCNL